MEAEKEYLIHLFHIIGPLDCIKEKMNLLESFFEIKLPFNAEDRKMIDSIFRSVVSKTRKSLKILKNMIEKGKKRYGTEKYQKLVDAKNELVIELERNCYGLISRLDSEVIQHDSSNESISFFLLLKADLLRYITEWCNESERLKMITRTQNCYIQALNTAKMCYSPYSIVSLSISLNYSLFLYENNVSKKEAISIAQDILNNANSGTKETSDDEFAESTKLIQTIKENTSLWIIHEGE